MSRGLAFSVASTEFGYLTWICFPHLLSFICHSVTINWPVAPGCSLKSDDNKIYTGFNLTKMKNEKR